MTIRVALIGAGVMGADHARIASEDLSGATLQVVCDASHDRARLVAEATGADVAADPFEAIARRDVDAVIVASPDETHAPLALAAIAARKPVLCEKPLAPRSQDCMAVVEAELRAGARFVQVGFMRRFDPAYAELRRAAAEGALGRPLFLHNVHRNVRAPDGFVGHMAITNSAPHEFDVARFVLSAEPTTISAFQPATPQASGRAAPILLILETGAGPLVDVEVNNDAAYGYDVRCELVGERGTLEVASNARTRLNADLRAAEGYAADWRPRFAEAYRLQDKAWIDAIRSGVPSPVAAHAWDGFRASAIAEAGVRALLGGAKVAIEPILPPAPYRTEPSASLDGARAAAGKADGLIGGVGPDRSRASPTAPARPSVR